VKWSDLLDGLGAERSGSGDPVIRGLAYDSRAVAPGDCFVALRGELADGHEYIDAALKLGAVALLLEEPREAPVPVATVRDTRRTLAPLSARFFGSPANELALLGVTGTNGKTSTSYLVESILCAAGRNPGLIGTVEIRYADEHQRAVNTTPESLDLQRALRAMRTAGVDAVAMEVSSHGLALGRVEGCHFEVAAITNVTQDHLDFHETMDAYREAKALLFQKHLVVGGCAVVNVDDPSSPVFLSAAEQRGARTIRVSRDANREAEVRLLQAEYTLAGTHARVAILDEEVEITLPLLGDFNVENTLVALGMGAALGLSGEVLSRGIASCPQVPGRMERVGAEVPGAPTLLVDYAHTPDAVEKLLAAVRPLTKGRLITVFGCGGDRDRAKRPLMAEAAAAFSDLAIATSDNPRTEDPARILADVEVGLGAMNAVAPDSLATTERGCTTILDRREAIALAVELAEPSDAVVIAGKGHEDYQIIGREKLPFDDREEAARALRGRSA
jgi:UDP-N-acetylmuramoyl-L-alanyl-D-glutamate--2,6-diaminopimelate ligase